MGKTLGAMIAALRRERGMTQLELAEKMGVTDKAVSKWERDLSCPDIHTLPRLASCLGVSVDALVQVQTEASAPRKGPRELAGLVLKAVALAMGVAVLVLSILKKLDPESGMQLLAIGLTCAGISLISGRD